MIRFLPVALILATVPLAAQSAPTALRGEFIDDYGSRHTITDPSWTHHPAIRYQVVRWDTAGRYLVASNADSTFSRIDWVELEEMKPWTWAFCIVTWTAPSADSAANVRIARRETPRTGCNGFPFTRMRPLDGLP